MTAGAIIRMYKTAPFEPFAIHLADRRELFVRHPELIVLSAGGRIATVRNRAGLSEVLDVLLIVSLRPLSAAETKATR